MELYEFGASTLKYTESCNKRLRCRMQRLYQVVQRLSDKYRFEPESEDCI